MPLSGYCFLSTTAASGSLTAVQGVTQFLFSVGKQSNQSIEGCTARPIVAMTHIRKSAGNDVGGQRMFVFGGTDGGGWSDAGVCHSTDRSWAVLPSMPKGRRHASAAALGLGTAVHFFAFQ